MDLSHLLTLGLAAAATVGLVVAWFRVDASLEDKQRVFVRLSALLESWGFPHLSKIAAGLAVRDLTGVWRDTETLVQLCDDPKQAAGLLEANFYAQLARRLQDENDLKKITTAVRDREAALAARASTPPAS